MLRMRIGLASFLATAISMLWAPAALGITLSNIDVVGIQGADKDLVRSTTRLVIGNQYEARDPAFVSACRLVREQYPRASVSCNLIARANNEATYAIAFSAGGYTPRYAGTCVDGKGIPEALNRDIEAFERARQSVFDETGGRSGREFVGIDGSLDYQDPRLHEARNKLVNAVTEERAAVVDAARRCDPGIKVKALELLQYAGAPKTAVEAAMPEATHPDPAVRNISLRLLGTFAGSLDSASTEHVLNIACDAVQRGGFLDVNKALAVIDALEAKAAMQALKIDAACRAEIVRLSAEIDSPQIGGFANSIIRQRKDKGAPT